MKPEPRPISKMTEAFYRRERENHEHAKTMKQKMTLPKDIARCRGIGSDEEGWREGCDTCLRRLAIATDKPGARVNNMQPPPIIALWCEYHIPKKPENNVCNT